jgi:hypothetical protein
VDSGGILFEVSSRGLNWYKQGIIYGQSSDPSIFDFLGGGNFVRPGCDSNSRIS